MPNKQTCPDKETLAHFATRACGSHLHVTFGLLILLQLLELSAHLQTKKNTETEHKCALSIVPCFGATFPTCNPGSQRSGVAWSIVLCKAMQNYCGRKMGKGAKIKQCLTGAKSEERWTDAV